MRAAFFASCLLWACGSDGYSVVVHVHGGPARARRVEISVLRSCGEVGLLGDAPSSPIRQVVALEGLAPPLGAVVSGTYGLYGRAWDGECSLFASGCDWFAVEEGGRGVVQITLSPITPRDCTPGETCQSARCVPGDAGSSADGGPDGSADSGIPDDAGPDAALPDAAPPEPDAGRDGGLPSCDELYAQVEEYVLCRQDAEACEFFALTDGDSCEELCGSLGHQCLEALENDDQSENACKVAGPARCSEPHADQICVCTRE